MAVSQQSVLPPVTALLHFTVFLGGMQQSRGSGFYSCTCHDNSNSESGLYHPYFACKERSIGGK